MQAKQEEPKRFGRNMLSAFNKMPKYGVTEAVGAFKSR